MRYRNELMPKCVDKYEVREFVKSKGLENILVPLYGVYDNIEEIDFKELPYSFIAKYTDGGGGNGIFVCRNKHNIKLEDIRTVLDRNISLKKFNPGREWAYTKMGKSRILVEKLLENSDGNSLIDYKFMCFNGKAIYLYVMSNRELGTDAALSIYDRNFNKLNVYEIGERKATWLIPKPQNFKEMVEIADKLSSDFPQVRVDLYNVDGKIYFGELTFYDESGYTRFDPDEFDFELGSYFTEFQD